MFIRVRRGMNEVMVVVMFIFASIYFFFGFVGGGVVIGVVEFFGDIIHLFLG